MVNLKPFEDSAKVVQTLYFSKFSLIHKHFAVANFAFPPAAYGNVFCATVCVSLSSVFKIALTIFVLPLNRLCRIVGTVFRLAIFRPLNANFLVGRPIFINRCFPFWVIPLIVQLARLAMVLQTIRWFGQFVEPCGIFFNAAFCAGLNRHASHLLDLEPRPE